MKKGLVSIIIPSYNRETLIGETLESVINQSYAHWECLVVDDGSADKTEAEVLKFAELDTRISYHSRPSNRPKGANACRNYGLELSQGEFINWFDSDDIMHEDKLHLQVEALNKTDRFFSVCQTQVFEDSIENNLGLNSQKISSNSIIEDFFTKKIVWLTQAPVFKLDFLTANSLSFNEELQAGQDWEFFMRVLFKENSYHTIDKPLVYLRRHKNSISASFNNDKEWHYFLARFSIYKQYNEHFTSKMAHYIRYFFIKSFKEFLRGKHYKKAYFIWKKCILGDHKTSFKDHLLLMTSFFSFVIFNKGDVFLTKVS